MTKRGSAFLRSTVTALLALGAMPVSALAADLSMYRDFQLGSDLPTVAKQAGVTPAQATVVYSRPELIQELEWRPQPLGSSSKAEPVKEVAFRFYNGVLFQIAVNYDRYLTEGLTNDDIIAAISAAYGIAAKPTASAELVKGSYGEQETLLAQWQDPQYRFDLIRSSYGPSFRLVGVLKRLEAPAEAATVEAVRLHEQEAPQREADRIASDEEAARLKLEKARTENKSTFRP